MTCSILFKGVQTAGQVDTQQVRLTHISVSVSQCPPPPSGEVSICVTLSLQFSSLVLLGGSPRQDLPPKGERGCICSLFPSRPIWSEGIVGPSDWTAYIRCRRGPRDKGQVSAPYPSLVPGFKPDENANCPGQSRPEYPNLILFQISSQVQGNIQCFAIAEHQCFAIAEHSMFRYSGTSNVPL